MTNNPKKRVGLIGYGLEIVENISIEVCPNPHNESYLLTKRDKMGHEILKDLHPGNSVLAKLSAKACPKNYYLYLTLHFMC